MMQPHLEGIERIPALVWLHIVSGIKFL